MTASGDRAREGTLDLDDGRALGFAEYGEPDGAPIMYLHGMPGSRLDPALLDEEYRRIGVRVVAIERPGYGLSAARRSWGLLDWPADVAAAAEASGSNASPSSATRAAANTRRPAHTHCPTA